MTLPTKASNYGNTQDLFSTTQKTFAESSRGMRRGFGSSGQRLPHASELTRDPTLGKKKRSIRVASRRLAQGNAMDRNLKGSLRSFRI